MKSNKKKVKTKKPRKFRGDWSGMSDWTTREPLGAEELEQLKKDSLDAFDEWTWETGSDEDKEKYQKLEKKLKKELEIAEIQSEIDEIMSNLADDIRKAVDDDILTGVLSASLDNTKKI